MKQTITTLAATTAIGLVSTITSIQSVRAATLTYDFGGSNRNQMSFSFTPVDFSSPVVTATGSEAGVSKQVRRRPDGLGIRGSSNPGQIDGRGGDFESLFLNFDRQVIIESATFANVQGNDEFTLFVDGDLLVNGSDIVNDSFDFSSLATSGRQGTEFEFTVSEENDDYRLSSVSVTPVPETSFVLPILGFGLMGLLSFRKHKFL